MLFIFSELVQFIYQLFSNKSRFLGLLGIGTLGYLAGSASPSTTTDYPTYASAYYVNHAGNYYFETGYSKLSDIFYYHGFSYAQFRLFFGLICAFILYIGILRFTKNAGLFSAIYGVTVFFNDATQIRNFLMIALVVFGSSFLIERSLKNNIIAGIIIILSAQFQSLGYLFLILIIMNYIPVNKLKKSLIWIILVAIILLVVFEIIGPEKIISIATSLLSVISDRQGLVDKISSKYTYGTGSLRLFVVCISTILGVFLENLFLKQNFINSDDILYLKKQKIIYIGMILSLLMLPTLFVAVDYSRIQRNAFVFLIIGICVYYDEVSEKKLKKDLLLSVYVVMVCISYAVTHFYVWGPFYERSVPYLAKILN